MCLSSTFHQLKCRIALNHASGGNTMQYTNIWRNLRSVYLSALGFVTFGFTNVLHVKCYLLDFLISIMIWIEAWKHITNCSCCFIYTPAPPKATQKGWSFNSIWSSWGCYKVYLYSALYWPHLWDCFELLFKLELCLVTGIKGFPSIKFEIE